MRIKHKLVVAASIALSSSMPITTLAATPNWNWQYFSPYTTGTGVPTNMLNISSEIPVKLRDAVIAKLPESLDVRKNVNKNLITDDLGANLYFVENAEVTVAFLDEGAGYRNSLGFFTFDP